MNICLHEDICHEYLHGNIHQKYQHQYVHEYLQDRAHLLRVDLLNPRILQTDALLMHSGAEKNKLTS